MNGCFCHLRLVVDITDLFHHEVEVVVPGQGLVGQVGVCPQKEGIT